MAVDTGIEVGAVVLGQSSTEGLPTRAGRPAPIAHQINVGQELLSAISASINTVDVAAWQPPIIEPTKPITSGVKIKTSNAAAKLATSHRAARMNQLDGEPALTVRWATAEMRGSLAPLRPSPRPWRGAVNEVFDWSAPIWGSVKFRPQIRDVGEIRSVMEEPRFDLWARVRSDDEDPLDMTVRIAGSSCESAVFNLATRRASDSRNRLHTAYILALMLGFVGVHQLYLNRIMHGLIHMVVALTTVVMFRCGMGAAVFVPLAMALVADLVLMPVYERRSSGSFWSS